MRYCSRCILPDTRPGLTIGENGVCSACIGSDEKASRIDWHDRQNEFEELVGRIKSLNRPFDCIVPVSGGKDSTYQVSKCLDYGLHVLAVTWKTPGRTKIGQENLDNLIRLGVDHIDYSVNPEVERKFTYKALVKTGSTGVPMHFGLYIIPLRFAVALNIPLVVWGESPAMEYGGTREERLNNTLDHTFLTTHGILQGTQIDDWVDEELKAKDLEIYRLPSQEDFRRVKLQSVFIGYYFNWSPQDSLSHALKCGFKVRQEGPKVGYYNYADIDCDFISIHHYFKYLKFGFTRLFDNLSLEIRNGHMTRKQAIEYLENAGEQVPHEDVEHLCEFLRISKEEFWKIAETFRNPAIWSKQNGKNVIEGFITDNWQWR